MNKEMSSALKVTLKAIEKDWGKGAVMRLSDEVKPSKDIASSSGSISLDEALGIGGYAKGRIIEIYGPESSGKTTLCLHAIAEAQAAGGVCAFIDAEHALDPVYAAKVGVDTSELLISQPNFGEQALGIVNALAKSGEVSLIVVDSVAALVPKAELEGEVGDSHIGRQARLMSQTLRMIAGSVSKTNCIVIFTNQIRMKIGVMFGSPETTTGGNALKFYASQRLDIRRIGAVKIKEEEVGNRVKIKVVKNKMAPPKRIAELDIIYGMGIDQHKELIELAIEKGFVEKNGAWFKYNDENIAQGMANACDYFKENPDILEEIRLKVLKDIGLVEEEVEEIVSD